MLKLPTNTFQPSLEEYIPTELPLLPETYYHVCIHDQIARDTIVLVDHVSYE